MVSQIPSSFFADYDSSDSESDVFQSPKRQCTAAQGAENTEIISLFEQDKNQPYEAALESLKIEGSQVDPKEASKILWLTALQSPNNIETLAKYLSTLEKEEKIFVEKLRQELVEQIALFHEEKIYKNLTNTNLNKQKKSIKHFIIESELKNFIKNIEKIGINFDNKKCSIGLKKNRFYFELNLKKITKNNITVLRAILKHFCIEEIRICRSNFQEYLTEYIVVEIFELIKNSSIRSLDLGEHCFESTESIVAFKNGLASDSQLQSLNLEMCDLDSEAGKAIAEGLETNLTLKKLNLRENENLGSEGLLAIVKALKDNSELEDLNVLDCQMEFETMLALVNALQENRSLTHLRIDLYSASTPVQIQELLEAINRSHLEEIEVDEDDTFFIIDNSFSMDHLTDEQNKFLNSSNDALVEILMKNRDNRKNKKSSLHSLLFHETME